MHLRTSFNNFSESKRRKFGPSEKISFWQNDWRHSSAIPSPVSFILAQFCAPLEVKILISFLKG